MLELIYYFLPAYVANGLPPILVKLPLLERWNAPVDFGKEWRGARLLGAHKTWRGIIGGTLLAGIVFLAQQALGWSSIPYASLPWWHGFLFGFGALLIGDCGESFLKRRWRIRPGKPWIPFDQIDYTIGAFLATSWLYWPGWLGFAFLLILNSLFSAAAHNLAKRVGITKEVI